MISRLAVRPLAQAIRHSSQTSGNYGLQLAKFKGQTPTGYIEDGWAMSRLPFFAHNKWVFATKAIIFLAVGFWAPFVVVEYQLRKANQ
uniref:Cytochrome c oxidase polypeptide VIIc n=1 Tax=Panagrolaimus sp. JU765 TaxID=591449 RepID=A0AC34RN67_9BILA